MRERETDRERASERERQMAKGQHQWETRDTTSYTWWATRRPRSPMPTIIKRECGGGETGSREEVGEGCQRVKGHSSDGRPGESVESRRSRPRRTREGSRRGAVAGMSRNMRCGTPCDTSGDMAGVTSGDTSGDMTGIAPSATAPVATPAATPAATASCSSGARQRILPVHRRSCDHLGLLGNSRGIYLCAQYTWYSDNTRFQSSRDPDLEGKKGRYLLLNGSFATVLPHPKSGLQRR